MENPVAETVLVPVAVPTESIVAAVSEAVNEAVAEAVPEAVAEAVAEIEDETEEEDFSWLESRLDSIGHAVSQLQQVQAETVRVLNEATEMVRQTEAQVTIMTERSLVEPAMPETESENIIPLTGQPEEITETAEEIVPEEIAQPEPEPLPVVEGPPVPSTNAKRYHRI